METRLESGKYIAEHADLSGCRFHDVNLAGCSFHDVNLSAADYNDVNMNKVRFHNINLSHISISAAHMGGASFKHVGLPDGSEGRQEPLRFEECDLGGTSFVRCDLSNVEIRDCDVSGMRIDGIPIDELLRAHQQHRS